jgi:uncharacterized membrane protein
MIEIGSVLNGISNCIEWISVLILIFGFVKGLLAFISCEYNSIYSGSKEEKITSVRPLLARYILLGLDFYIISDIISSMVQEELNDLISLTVIVVLRTTIGYFLSKEILELKAEIK